MARNNANDADTKKHNVIAYGTKIVGNISSDGDIRIDGEIEGELKISGRVVLGKTSKVSGQITCANAEILGQFNGELTVSDTLSVRNTANISGDITTNKITVDIDAKFNGTCNMNQQTTHEDKKKR